MGLCIYAREMAELPGVATVNDAKGNPAFYFWWGFIFNFELSALFNNYSYLSMAKTKERR